uniref:Uncharacterized protein n=1 Tax=Anopheles merus TaxID=30066 RepID=A0A182VBS4_ANOME
MFCLTKNTIVIAQATVADFERIALGRELFHGMKTDLKPLEIIGNEISARPGHGGCAALQIVTTIPNNMSPLAPRRSPVRRPARFADPWPARPAGDAFWNEFSDNTRAAAEMTLKRMSSSYIFGREQRTR